jgi:RNA polymerase sigma factor (sigma-70 family)
MVKSKEDEYAEILAIQSGQLDLVDHFLEQNAGLVHSLAEKYRAKGVEYDDLVQVGMLGLLDALDKFDVSRGNRFSTVAYPWIRGRMTREIERASKASADQIVTDMETPDRADKIAIDESLQPDIIAYTKALNTALRDAIEELPERQQVIVAAYYGLNGEKEHSMQELAETFGLSKGTIFNSLATVRKKLAQNENLKDFFEIH